MDTFRNMDRKLYSSLGAYPAFLWLFKDIISELREQFIFQDHLLDHVRQWKEQIYNQLQTERNIIYIGVHCRYSTVLYSTVQYSTTI